MGFPRPSSTGLPSAPTFCTFMGSTNFTVSYGRRFWATPCDTSTSAPGRQKGKRTHNDERTRSTQKFPMVCICRRAMPRMKAIASAMPVAAEMKL